MSIEDRVETLSVRVVEDDRLPYLSEPGFIAAQRRHAAASLADKLFADASVQRERRDSDSGQVERIWTVSVVLPANGRNRFAEQINAAYQRGVADSAEHLRQAAGRYRDRNAGPCSHSIASALGSEAGALEKLAREADGSE